MRKLIAAALPIGFLMACGGTNRVEETASSVPHRDLTLTTSPAASVQVASGIELTSVRTVRHSKAPRRAAYESIAPAAPVAAPAAEVPSISTPEPLPSPAVEAVPASASLSRELAPGATVTVIPVSSQASGSGGAGDDWSELPSAGRGGGVMIGGGHGGNCRGGGGRGPVSILK